MKRRFYNCIKWPLCFIQKIDGKPVQWCLPSTLAAHILCASLWDDLYNMYTCMHPTHLLFLIRDHYVKLCHTACSPVFPNVCHMVSIEWDESAPGCIKNIIVMCGVFDPSLTRSVWSTLLWPFHVWSQQRSLDTYWYRLTAVSQAHWVVLCDTRTHHDWSWK